MSPPPKGKILLAPEKRSETRLTQSSDTQSKVSALILPVDFTLRLALVVSVPKHDASNADELLLPETSAYLI